MMNFHIKCNKCQSEDVGFTAQEDEFNQIEIFAYCRNCKNEEEVTSSY